MDPSTNVWVIDYDPSAAPGLPALLGERARVGSTIYVKTSAPDTGWTIGTASLGNLTATYVGFGSATNVLTGSASLTWNDTNKTLTIATATAGGNVGIKLTGATDVSIPGQEWYINGTLAALMYAQKVTTLPQDPYWLNVGVLGAEPADYGPAFTVTGESADGNAALLVFAASQDVIVGPNHGQPATNSTIGFFHFGGMNGDPTTEPKYHDGGRASMTYNYTGRRFWIHSEGDDWRPVGQWTGGTGAGYLITDNTGFWTHSATIPAADVVLTATRVPFGSAGNVLTSEASFVYLSSPRRLGIGLANPLRLIHVYQSVDDGAAVVASNDNAGTHAVCGFFGARDPTTLADETMSLYMTGTGYDAGDGKINAGDGVVEHGCEAGGNLVSSEYGTGDFLWVVTLDDPPDPDNRAIRMTLTNAGILQPHVSINVAAGVLVAGVISAADKIGVFDKTPAIQQTGGAATAGALYTATEQAMLQTAYDALRTYGWLT